MLLLGAILIVVGCWLHEQNEPLAPRIVAVGATLVSISVMLTLFSILYYLRGVRGL